jgi:RNA polymerase sigma-70 factor (ECF subfamily)
MPDFSLELSASASGRQTLLDRVRIGDPAALDELFRSVGASLDRMAQRMLKSFPGVERWVQSEDILQNALIRLLRALREVRITSMQQLFRLAAVQLRRELLDLARHYSDSRHSGTRYTAAIGQGAEAAPCKATEETTDLEEWAAFHEQVQHLPAQEREVVGLLFYHGWSQAEVAALFKVTIRTIQRRWQTALETIRHRLKGQ